MLMVLLWKGLDWVLNVALVAWLPPSEITLLGAPSEVPDAGFECAVEIWWPVE